MDHQDRVDPVVKTEDPFARSDRTAESSPGIEPLTVAGRSNDDGPQARCLTAGLQDRGVDPIIEDSTAQQVKRGQYDQPSVAVANQADPSPRRKPLDEPGE